MYLKSIIIENFRKFRNSGNKIEFINAEDYKKGVEIASKTTLIIGKNNSGKTTVIEALRKILKESKFNSTDFNFYYLKDLMKKYVKGYLDGTDVELPYIGFVFSVGIEDNNEDLLTNIIPFMSLDDVNKSEVDIRMEWQVKDKELFINEVKLLNRKHYGSDMKFDRFLELIDKTEFDLVYMDRNNSRIKNFSIKNLIEIEAIEANKITNDNCLSEAFQKIINYRYKRKEELNSSDLDKEITKLIVS